MNRDPVMKARLSEVLVRSAGRALCLVARRGSVPFCIVVAVLQGCATVPSESVQQTLEVAPPAGAAAATAVPSLPANQVTPQMHAEFEAALALLKVQKYEDSIAALNKLAAALPENPIPLINAALAYQQLGKTDLAEEHFKRALAIEPENPVASNELALLYRKKGRFMDARPLYEKTLKKYPNFSIAHKNLAVLCDLYLQDYACALAHYRLYSAEAPDDKNVKIWIADLEKRSGK